MGDSFYFCRHGVKNATWYTKTNILQINNLQI